MSGLEDLARVSWLDQLTQRADAFMTALRSLPEEVAVNAADAWLFVFRERNLLFASWPVAPEALRPHVPLPLDLDLFDGSAWITVEALQTALVRFRRLPDNPLAFDGVEMNVRTYVRGIL